MGARYSPRARFVFRINNICKKVRQECRTRPSEVIMKKTKKLSILAAVALSVCACVTVTACQNNEDSHTHEYSWVVTDAPTVTEGGKITGTCSADNETTVVDVPALSDTAFWTAKTTSPTHTQAGYTEYTSSEYNVTVKVGGADALGHDWESWQVKPDSVPTQTAEGTAVRYCSADDGGEETAALKALSDTSFWTVDEDASSDPTHATEGKTVYKNSTYNVTVTETIPAAGHRWSTWSLKAGAEPTLNDGGKMIRTCLDSDGGVEEIDVPKLSDTSFWTAGALTAPTCTSQGSRIYTNSRYSLSYTMPIDELGHSWSKWTWKDGVEPTTSVGGTLERHCTRDDDTATKQTVQVAALSDTTVWTKDANGIAASYNTAGFDVFTANIEGVDEEITVKAKTANKLAAPYDNKKYVSLYYQYPDSYDKNPARTSNWGYNYDEEGKNKLSLFMPQVFNPVAGDYAAACFNSYAFPFRGHITLEYVDEATGKVKFVCREAEFPSNAGGGDEDGEWGSAEGYSLGRAVTEPTVVEGGAVTELYGYVDKTTGILVVPSSSRILVFVPVEIDDFTTTEALNTVDAITTTCSMWNGGAALSVKKSAESAELNVFVRGNDAYVGVQFKDSPESDATDISAANCSSSDYVVVFDKDGEKLCAFGKNASGALVESDGFDGVYTGAVDIYNFETKSKQKVAVSVKLNGAGKGVVVSGSSELTGTTLRYVKAPQGSEHTLDLYVVKNDTDAVYYKVTANLDNMTFTSELPIITITLNYNNDSYEDISKQWYGNIASDLSPIEAGGFLGWYTDPEFDGSPITEIKSLTDVEVYAKWSTLFIEFKLTGKDGDTIKKSYFAAGDSLGSVLPELTDAQQINPVNNTQFIGWFTTIDGTEYSVDADAVLSEANAGGVYYGKWAPLGIWSFEMDNKYGWVYDKTTGYWKSNNKGQNTTTAFMSIYAKDGPITISFKYWANCEGGSYDYLKIWRYWMENGSLKNETVDISNKKLTIADAKEYTRTLAAGEYIKLDYVKDGSGDGGSEDYAYLADLKINGRTITVAASPDFLEGTYTATEQSDLVLDGYGNFTWGEKSGTYTAVEGKDYGFDMYVVDGGKQTEYYELTITGTTYSVTKPTVNVIYSAGDHAVPQSTSVNKNVEFTLADGVADTGYTFRGWYTKDGSESGDWGDKVTTVKPADNVTVYGRYDAQVTITWNYLVSGVENATDSTKFVTDSVETVQSTDGITNSGKVFAGWFTKDGSTTGDWGEQVTENTVLSGETVTFYAKWVVPAASAGIYRGWNMDDDKESGTKTIGSQSVQATITKLGGYSGGRLTAGSLSESDMKVTDGVIHLGRYAYFNADAGIIWYPYRATVDSLDNDTQIAFDEAKVNSVLYSGMKGSNGTSTYVAWFTITYKDNTVKNAFGFNNKIYFDVTWTEGVTADKANTSNVEVSDKDGKLIVIFHEGKFAIPDASRGTYICAGKDNLFFNGGDSFVWGEKTGTYVAVDGAENTYKLLVKEGSNTVESHTVVIDMTDPENRTYTVSENKVDISFVTAHSSQEGVSVFADVAYALPTGLTESGYIFRGWYTEDGTDGEWGDKTSSVTPSAGQSYTYYAKWDAAATVTWNYLVSGVDNDTTSTTGKYVNDTVGTVKSIGEVTNGELVFVGWFTKDGSTTKDWGEQVTENTVISGETVTFYAKWAAPSPLMGSYKGWEAYQGKWQSVSAFNNMTVDAFGKATGKFTGTVENYDPQTGIFNIVNGSNRRIGYYDSVSKLIMIGFGSNQTAFNDDVYILFNTNVATTITSQTGSNYAARWRSGASSAYDNFVVYADFDGTTKFIFRNGDKAYYDVSVKVNNVAATPTTLKDANQKDGILEITLKGTTLFKGKYDGSTFAGDDGMSGSYAGEYGNIVTDGYGSLTIAGGTAVAYTVIDGKKITFVHASRMYVVTLSDGAYTKSLDGYEGTYTLPDNAGTIVLDGYGMAGANNTYYVVNDSTITIFNPSNDTSVSYGIDKENKVLLGKSVFAGKSFNGTYRAGGFDAKAQLIFDDASTITGQLLIQEEDDVNYRWCAYNISGVLDGNILTVTVVSLASVTGYNNSLSSAVGQTFTMEYDGNADPVTLKFTSTLKLGYVSSSLNNVVTKQQ